MRQSTSFRRRPTTASFGVRCCGSRKRDIGVDVEYANRERTRAGSVRSPFDGTMRIGSEDPKELYKKRAAIAECVNSQARNRGLLRMPVRGLAKVRCVVGLFMLAHNLMRMATLAPTCRPGDSSVQNCRTGRMRGQKMTQNLKMGSARANSTSIRRIYRLAHQRVDGIAKTFGTAANPVGFRKTLAL